MSREERQTEIRGDWRMVFLGSLAGVLVRLLRATMRIRIVDPSGLLVRLREDPAPLIHCLWHNQMLYAFLCLRKAARPVTKVVLTSASRDGAALAALAKSFRCEAVRGSSSRRGRSALMTLIRELRKGRDAAITPDGPRGPRYSLQAGVVKLAQATGVPILQTGFECSAEWRLKSWDHFRIPKPFSRLTVILNPLLEVPRQLEDDQLEELRSDLEVRMRQGLDDLPPNEDET